MEATFTEIQRPNRQFVPERIGRLIQFADKEGGHGLGQMQRGGHAKGAAPGVRRIIGIESTGQHGDAAHLGDAAGARDIRLTDI